jgi:hypothetical protein
MIFMVNLIDKMITRRSMDETVQYLEMSTLGAPCCCLSYLYYRSEESSVCQLRTLGVYQSLHTSSTVLRMCSFSWILLLLSRTAAWSKDPSSNPQSQFFLLSLCCAAIMLLQYVWYLCYCFLLPASAYCSSISKYAQVLSFCTQE